MKIIYEGDHLVQTILGKKKITANEQYRWSDFVISRTCGGKSYLYHNFTKRCWQTDGDNFIVSRDKRFSTDEINADERLQTLVADLFLVPDKNDETAVYESYCRIARIMRRKNDGYSSFTILPTTACNARCIYCYEQGMQYVTMKEETVAQTVAFIKQVRNPKKPVRFMWFGGEPLVGEKIIDQICAEMRAADVEYTSTMISNGSLITRENILKLRDEWNLKSMQISLDGTEEEYNRRKNYYYHYESAYWHVLSRIKLVNENGIRLNIRVNVDEGNIDGVPQMVEDIKNFVVKPELIGFDIAPLFDLQASESGLRIWDKSFETSEWIAAQGFRVVPHYSVKNARYNFCMADDPYKALVIAPDGKLYNCEHIADVEPLGDVWQGITETQLMKKLVEVEPAREQCRGCFSLPHCTTFTGCPNVRVDCKYTARRRMERALDKMIRYYEKKAGEEKPGDPEEEQEC